MLTQSETSLLPNARWLWAQVIRAVLGGYASENRGADYVYLVPALRAGTRYLTGHRVPRNQAALACTAPGAGQHRDYAINT